MHIEAIELKNFRAFKHIKMQDIPKFCIIVGANGTGKSTIFQVFNFLKDAMSDNVQTALAKLGGGLGFKEVRTRNCSGSIEIIIKFRIEIDKPLCTYHLEIDEEEGQPIVVREVLSYRRGPRGKPWQFLNFRRGSGTAITNELAEIIDDTKLDRVEHTLKAKNILAIKGLSQFETFPAVKALGDLIQNWHISDFHITNARYENPYDFAEHLSKDGDNLSSVTDYLYKNHPQVFKAILNGLSHRVPGIADVETKITEEGRVLLKFRDGAFEDPFLARHVSDGTIKMLAYLILLYDPKPHPLLCVEEPENQLYPKLLTELAEEFRLYSQRGGQVFVSTHSPEFLNAAKLNEVFWLVKKSGFTDIKRANTDKQISEYMQDGDQLGYLWQQGFFENVDPQ